jgi:hypothetical protein
MRSSKAELVRNQDMTVFNFSNLKPFSTDIASIARLGDRCVLGLILRVQKRLFDQGG